MSVVRFYSDEEVSGRALQRAAKLCPQLSVSTELCYNVELTGEHVEYGFSNRLCQISEISVVSMRFFLLQALRVSALSRRRFSSGCFVLPSRRWRCLKHRNSPRVPAAGWWRSDQGTRSRFRLLILCVTALDSTSGSLNWEHSWDVCPSGDIKSKSSVTKLA